MQEEMPVTPLEAACRCEAQRVLAALRANRKFGDLSRGWRELEDDSPIRQLSEWRCSHHATAVSLLKPLLDIVRSPEFAGPTTHVALEAVHAVVTALCDTDSARVDLSCTSLPALLAEVSDAVCECIFAETHLQVDEATTMQMVTVLGWCATAEASLDVEAFPAEKRMRAFAKILSLWSHYHRSPTLRNGAQSSLQRMLDFACCNMDVQAPFMRMVLQNILDDITPDVSHDRLVLYLRCLQRLTTHPIAQRCIAENSPHAQIFQNNVPLLLMAVGEHFGTNVRVLALLLPVVNQICWLCIGNWQDSRVGSAVRERVAGLGALQVEALLSSIYIRIMSLAAAPLQAADTTVLPLTAEEGTEVLVLLLEALCDLCQPHTVRTVWYSFDLDWRRPALLEQLVRSIEALFQDSPSTERPLPAYVVHLSATVLTHIISAFNFSGDDFLSSDVLVADEEGVAQIKEQRQRRTLAKELLAKMEKSPKKTKAALEACGILNIIELAGVPLSQASTSQNATEPHEAAASSASATSASNESGIVEVFDEWSVKLAWFLRCLNHCVPYEAMGEFFGQNSKDSEMAFAAFVDSFDWGGRDMVEALRGMLLAFLIPKEAQQIDRVLKIFAYTFYRKQLEYCQSSEEGGVGYFRHPDAAYTLSFSMMMLNTDQHNPRLKKRMTFQDFKRNNRGINEGEDIPEDVLQVIFDNIHRDEIKTPSSGSLVEGVSASRWNDLMHLVERGYRDNSLVVNHPHLNAYALALYEQLGESLRNALESAFATDPGAHSDAGSGLGGLLRLALALQCPEADAVTEGLFFFGTEVFHEPQHKGAWGRASVSLRALFHTSLTHAACLSMKQLHMLVYITIQFALYGLIDRATALPPLEQVTAKLLRTPSLAVDPPTGVVYSFLRKISTVPFRVLSFTEDLNKLDDEQGSPEGVDGPSQPMEVQPQDVSGEAVASEERTPESKPESETPKEAAATPTAEPGSLAGDEAPTQEIPPSWPQIEQTFDTCGLDLFLRSLLSPWLSQDREEAEVPSTPQIKQMGSRAFFSFVSSLFLALRVAGPSKPSKDKDQDLPMCFEEESKPEVAAPQALQLPKRALGLNVLDGFETMRLGLRLLQCAIGNRQVVHTLEPDDVAAVQELSVHIHMGLAHTLRRSDLCERTLRVSLVSIFQIASALLSLRTSEGPVISLGWPIRLIDILVQRTATEPQLLVPTAKLSVDVIRLFVMEVSKHRPLGQLELWRYLLQLIIKAVPTAARALWPGTKDALVASVQMHLWQQGLVWLLGHPCLLDCLVAECNSAEAGSLEAPSVAAFWTWALGELGTLAEEMIPGNRPEAARLLLEAYKALLGYLVTVPEPSNGSKDSASVSSLLLDVRAIAWCRVAVSLLGSSGVLLTRPVTSNDSDQPLILLLKQALLNVRVPQLLTSTAQGPHSAKATLEKLVSVLTTAASAGAPIPCLREAVSLVAKFFLQNLQVLQRHECFSQLWLMVLRLMLLFIKRGSDGHDELEEIATETLKNLLCVLLNNKVLGFVSPKGGSTKDSPTVGGVPVWWQMSWDCIEVFLPGFGEEFASSLLPKTGCALPEGTSPASVASDGAAALPTQVALVMGEVQDAPVEAVSCAAPREDVGSQADVSAVDSADQAARGGNVSDAADGNTGHAGGAADKEASGVTPDSVEDTGTAGHAADEASSTTAGEEQW